MQQSTPTSIIQAPLPGATGAAVNAMGVPHMLFLNQVNIGGQTSFVLVDANNKPVQLPQGKKTTNIIQIIQICNGINKKPVQFYQGIQYCYLLEMLF